MFRERYPRVHLGVGVIVHSTYLQVRSRVSFPFLLSESCCFCPRCSDTFIAETFGTTVKSFSSSLRDCSHPLFGHLAARMARHVHIVLCVPRRVSLSLWYMQPSSPPSHCSVEMVGKFGRTEAPQPPLSFDNRPALSRSQRCVA